MRNKIFFSAFGLILILIIFFWKNIILYLNRNLLDYRDHAFVVWLIKNNINHFKNLDLKNLYETNAMYPFKYSLSFAEHFFFPSFVVFIISYFIKNPITQLEHIKIKKS